MKSIKLLLVILLPFFPVLVSCGHSTDEDHTYQNSDQLHMEQLKMLLTRKNIPFESIDGLIRYSSNVRAEFEKALKVFGSATTVEFIDNDIKNHFHMILYNEGIEFIDSDREYGGWTLWWPGSDERKKNILGQLTKHKKMLQIEEDLDCESGSNEAHAKPSLIQDILNNLADEKGLKGKDQSTSTN